MRRNFGLIFRSTYYYFDSGVYVTIFFKTYYELRLFKQAFKYDNDLSYLGSFKDRKRRRFYLPPHKSFSEISSKVFNSYLPHPFCISEGSRIDNTYELEFIFKTGAEVEEFDERVIKYCNDNNLYYLTIEENKLVLLNSLYMI